MGDFMKKIIFLCMFLLILCGCHADYNVFIDKDSISEEIDVSMEKNDINMRFVENDAYPMHSNFDKKYEKSVSYDGDMINMNVKYTYTPLEFANANSFNQCFNDKTVEVDNDEYYYFRLTDMNRCFLTANFDVNIKTNYKVISNNADSVKGNTYTWHVNEENMNNVLIEIRIDKNHVDNSGKMIYAYVIFGVVLAFIIFLIRSFVKKNNSRNDF